MPYVDRMQKVQSETDKCSQKADDIYRVLIII